MDRFENGPTTTAVDDVTLWNMVACAPWSMVVVHEAQRLSHSPINNELRAWSPVAGSPHKAPSTESTWHGPPKCFAGLVVHTYLPSLGFCTGLAFCLPKQKENPTKMLVKIQPTIWFSSNPRTHSVGPHPLAGFDNPHF